MLPITALKEMNVLIATPNYDGAKGNYVTSMFGVASALGQEGITAQLMMLTDSNICRGRGRLLRRFLDGAPNGIPYTHMLSWDADVGASVEQIARLLLSDLDVVAAAYPLKRYELPPAGQRMPEQEAQEFLLRSLIYPDPGAPLKPDENGFCKVQKVTTGMLCIKRQVFDRMIEAYPDEYYFYPGEPRLPHYTFFENMLDKETREILSEDYAFCRRWTDIGGEVYLDIHSKLSHCGAMIFQGDLLGHLKASREKPKIIMPPGIRAGGG